MSQEQNIVVVGAGSGGSLCSDFLAPDPSIAKVTIFDHDTLEAANVARHLAGRSSVGLRKVDILRDRLRDIRPDVEVVRYPLDITSPDGSKALRAALTQATAAVCAVDVESAKLTFNNLCLETGTPWTLGEVLSGGIGGFVHCFRPRSSACYACALGFLGREVKERPHVRDYAAEESRFAASLRIPASKASIAFIAALHAVETLKLIHRPEYAPQGHSILIGMVEEPGMFDRTYEGRRFVIPTDPTCLVCGSRENSQIDVESALASIPEVGP